MSIDAVNSVLLVNERQYRCSL